ncbi:MAG: FAD-dependent oxidoreductase [Elusimicrobia bacterium]|nr:FAD-dependent oxidoreductase [Elusimicrobiota bacterium]
MRERAAAPVRAASWEAVIVGGGPAGLAAGIHLARAGYRTLLIERGALGGEAARLDRVENYPGFPQGIAGRDLMSLWVRQARRWGLEFRRAEARGVERRAGVFGVKLSKGGVIRTYAVILCPGAEFRRLGVPGEKRLAGAGVWNAALDVSRRWRGKTVAVAGSGETALRQALSLSRFAAHVHLLSRSGRLKANRLLRWRLSECGNVSLLPGAVIERLEGRRALETLRVRVGRNGGTERVSVKADALFVLAGKEGRRFPVQGGGRSPGIFAAGDASSGRFRQVAVAGGDGLRAAMKCMEFLEAALMKRHMPPRLLASPRGRKVT